MVFEAHSFNLTRAGIVAFLHCAATPTGYTAKQDYLSVFLFEQFFELFIF